MSLTKTIEKVLSGQYVAEEIDQIALALKEACEIIKLGTDANSEDKLDIFLARAALFEDNTDKKFAKTT